MHPEREGSPAASVNLWPELLAAGALLGAVFFLIWRITSITSGQFAYCLDDAYIHMAIAKNFVEHHVWGITPYAFTSASSSPLWILLLALDFLVQGANEIIPLILNVLCALAALFVAGSALRRRRLPQWLILILLVAILFLAAIPTVIFDGMEHSLHVLLVFLWIAVLDAIPGEGTLPRRALLALCVLAPLLTACRYESLFLIFFTCVVLALRRQWKAAVLVGACAWLSIGLFAAYSLMHGWGAFPNSVLLKVRTEDWLSARYPALVRFGGRGALLLATQPYLAVLMAGPLFLLWWTRRTGQRFWEGRRAILFIFVTTLFFHLQFARTGWFFRYEAYLIAGGLLILGLALAPGEDATATVHLPTWAVGVAALLLALPLAQRGRIAFLQTPLAAQQIHDQSWEVGDFLKQEMGDSSVAVVDIGAAAFLSETHILDFAGLASLDTAHLREHHDSFSVEDVERLTRTHGVKLAIIYPTPYLQTLPKTWKLLGSWRVLAPYVILGKQRMSFVAVDPADAPELEKRLAAFSRRLPKDRVEVSLAPAG